MSYVEAIEQRDAIFSSNPEAISNIQLSPGIRIDSIDGNEMSISFGYYDVSGVFHSVNFLNDHDIKNAENAGVFFKLCESESGGKNNERTINQEIELLRDGRDTSKVLHTIIADVSHDDNKRPYQVFFFQIENGISLCHVHIQPRNQTQLENRSIRIPLKKDPIHLPPKRVPLDCASGGKINNMDIKKAPFILNDNAVSH